MITSIMMIMMIMMMMMMIIIIIIMKYKFCLNFFLVYNFISNLSAPEFRKF